MIIKTDQQGRHIIAQQLCDADLRLNGVNAFQRVGLVLQSIQILVPEPENAEPDQKKDKPK